MRGYQNELGRGAGELGLDIVELPPGVRELMQPYDELALSNELQLFGQKARRSLVAGMKDMAARDCIRARR